MNIKEVLSEIDSKPFIKSVSDMVYEVSLGDDVKRAKAHELMTMAVRCACLLDLYHETGDPVYLEEVEKQRSELYQTVPKNYHRVLMAEEESVRKFFEYEKSLRRRIQAGDRFTEDDIRQYLDGKSGDTLFYGRLLKIFVPEWDLTDELRIQTILFDIGKDIADYEDDMAEGLPNVLYMFLSESVRKEEIPNDLERAVSLANELGITNNLLELAAGLKDKALASKNLDSSPTLKKAIIDRYNQIEQLLVPS